MVVLVAPELIPIITIIPGAEFNPKSDNFSATVKQVFVTLGRVGPQVIGGGLAALAGPAHTGLYQIAMERDRREFMQHQAMSRELSLINKAILNGELDYIPWLDKIISELNAREFESQGMAQAASDVIRNAQLRRQALSAELSKMLNESTEMQRRVDRKYPTLLRPQRGK